MIRDIDRGYAKRIKAIREGTAGRKLTVGVHESEGSETHEDGDATIAEIAAAHEFGTDDIPQRSFISGWVDENAAQNTEILSGACKQVAAGKLPIDQALDQAGAVMAGDVQQRMRDGIEPALEEATIEAKGSSTPLIDKGQLIQAVTWAVKK